MKTAIFSLAMISMSLLQVEALACHPSSTSRGKKTPGKTPPLAITQTGVPPYVPGIDPTTGQVVMVPNPLFPSNGMVPNPGSPLVPTSNMVLNQYQGLAPSHNMLAYPPAGAQPTHGSSPFSSSAELQATNGTAPYGSAATAQPTHGYLPMGVANVPQPVQLVSMQQSDAGSAPTHTPNQGANQVAQLWAQMNSAPAGTLKQAVLSPDPLCRYVAAQTIGARKLPCQAELIALLADSNTYVRQAARQSLVQLSESVSKKAEDFGPAPGANDTQLKQAATSWKNYWQTIETPKG